MRGPFTRNVACNCRRGSPKNATELIRLKLKCRRFIMVITGSFTAVMITCKGGPPWPPLVDGHELPGKWAGHGAPPLQALLEEHSQELAAADLDQRFRAALRAELQLHIIHSFAVQSNSALRYEPLSLGDRGGETICHHQFDQSYWARRFLDGWNVGRRLMLAEHSIEFTIRLFCFGLR